MLTDYDFFFYFYLHKLTVRSSIAPHQDTWPANFREQPLLTLQLYCDVERTIRQETF